MPYFQTLREQSLIKFCWLLPDHCVAARPSSSDHGQQDNHESWITLTKRYYEASRQVEWIYNRIAPYYSLHTRSERNNDWFVWNINYGSRTSDTLNIDCIWYLTADEYFVNIFRPNADFLVMRPNRTHFSKSWMKIETFVFKNND